MPYWPATFGQLLIDWAISSREQAWPIAWGAARLTGGPSPDTLTGPGRVGLGRQEAFCSHTAVFLIVEEAANAGPRHILSDRPFSG